MDETKKIKVLHLVLKKEWYEMQESGVKTEEYRSITHYWVRRLVDVNFFVKHYHLDINSISLYNLFVYTIFFSRRIKPFTHVCFHYGYTRRCFIHRIDSITFGFGKPEWGAPKGKLVFIIRHHKEI